jgi:DNA-directed RNA polymerase specialized sigma24 family protein
MPDRRARHEDLLRQYVGPLPRLAWSYEDDPAAREDLFQEISMALWTALPRFRSDSTARTRVYRVVARDDAGQVVALVLHQNGIDQRATKVQ